MKYWRKNSSLGQVIPLVTPSVALGVHCHIESYVPQLIPSDCEKSNNDISIYL